MKVFKAWFWIIKVTLTVLLLDPFSETPKITRVKKFRRVILIDELQKFWIL